MKKTVLIALLFALATISIFAGGNAEETRELASDSLFPKMTLQLAHVNPTTDKDQYHKFATLFAEKIYAATNGAITVEVYGNTQLGGEREALEGMQIGTIDMGVNSNFQISAINPPSNMIELPFLFKDRETVFKFLDSDINEEISNHLYETKGIKILVFGEGGFRYVLNNVRPIRTLEDFKGIKIRLGETPIYLDTFNALGANATGISFSETFTAVQQGTVDGMELPVITASTGGYDEIHKYISKTDHFFNALALTISRQVWDSFNDEQQKIFKEVAIETSIEQRKFAANIENELLNEMIEDGIIYNEDTDKESFREAVKPVYDKYRSLIGVDLFNRSMALIND
jgi:tripartite ATP-independent transporter DctP family solute receptor